MKCLGSREGHAAVWDSVNWELSTTYFTLATLLQDYAPLSRKAQEQVTYAYTHTFIWLYRWLFLYVLWKHVSCSVVFVCFRLRGKWQRLWWSLCAIVTSRQNQPASHYTSTEQQLSTIGWLLCTTVATVTRYACKCIFLQSRPSEQPPVHLLMLMIFVHSLSSQLEWKNIESRLLNACTKEQAM